MSSNQWWPSLSSRIATNWFKIRLSSMQHWPGGRCRKRTVSLGSGVRGGRGWGKLLLISLRSASRLHGGISSSITKRWKKARESSGFQTLTVERQSVKVGGRLVTAYELIECRIVSLVKSREMTGKMSGRFSAQVCWRMFYRQWKK